ADAYLGVDAVAARINDATAVGRPRRVRVGTMFGGELYRARGIDGAVRLYLRQPELPAIRRAALPLKDDPVAPGRPIRLLVVAGKAGGAPIRSVAIDGTDIGRALVGLLILPLGPFEDDVSSGRIEHRLLKTPTELVGWPSQHRKHRGAAD